MDSARSTPPERHLPQTDPLPPSLRGTGGTSEFVLGRVVCEDGSPNMERVQFRILPGRHTAVGRIVGIRHRRPSREPVMTLVRVEEMHEFNPHEDAASSTVSDVIPFETRYAPEGRSTVIYRAAQGELLEEAVLNPDGSLNRIESPETLPISGSPVVDVPPAFIAKPLNFGPGPG